MQDRTKQIQSAVEKLLQDDENQLYEQLGIRAKAIAADHNIGSSFDPQVTYDQAEIGLKEELQEFGQRLFQRWNVEAYKLICGSYPEDQKDREGLVNAFGKGDLAVAVALAVLLVTHLGLAPALAAVVAALTIKRFFRPAYEEFCEVWKSNLS